MNGFSPDELGCLVAIISILWMPGLIAFLEITAWIDWKLWKRRLQNKRRNSCGGKRIVAGVVP